MPCRAELGRDRSEIGRGLKGSCCALKRNSQSLKVATGMATAAVCYTSRIRYRAGWNSSRRYASNRDPGIAADAVLCASLARVAAWLIRVSAALCKFSMPSSRRLISGRSFCASCTSEMGFFRAPISVFSSLIAVWFSIAKMGALRMHWIIVCLYTLHHRQTFSNGSFRSSGGIRIGALLMSHVAVECPVCPCRRHHVALLCWGPAPGRHGVLALLRWIVALHRLHFLNQWSSFPHSMQCPAAFLARQFSY